MILPKIYTDPHGNYPQHKNKPKMSYSFYNGWKELGYKGECIANYFLEIPSEGNIFTAYGSLCGKYFEDKTDLGLSEFDKSVIDKIERHENAKYESEIVVDRGSYVIQGYSDLEYMIEEGLCIEDMKTGSISSKKDFYSGDDYNQTLLYCYQREKEGNKIAYSGVILFDRKGNGTDKHPLRLTGEIEKIPTPYSTEKAEKFLKDFDKTTKEINEAYIIYNKYFK